MNHQLELKKFEDKYKNLWGGVNLKNINAYDFEEVAALFFSIYFNTPVHTTQKSMDHGIDAYIKQNHQYTMLFQVKKYGKNNKVGEPVVRDLYGVMAAYALQQNGNQPKGIVVTTGEFSPSAITWAQGKNIILINGPTLVKLFHQKGFINFYLDFYETPTTIYRKAQEIQKEVRRRAQAKKYAEQTMLHKQEEMRLDALKHQQILQEKEEERKKKIQHPVGTQGKVDNKYEDCDELLDEAIKIIVESRQVSASYLQRRLKISFNRAARILEELESSGIISARDENKPRQVLVSKEDKTYKKEIEEATRKKAEEQTRLEVVKQELEQKQLEAERKKLEKQLAKVKLRHEKEVKKQQQAELKRETRKMQDEEIRLKRQDQKELREKKRQEREAERKRKLTEEQQKFKEKYGWRRMDIRALQIAEMCAWIVGVIIPSGIATYLPGGTNHNMYVLGIYINVALVIHIMWKYVRFKNEKNIFEDRNILMILPKVVLGFLGFVACMASYWVLGILFLILLVVNYYVLHKIFIKDTKSN